MRTSTLFDAKNSGFFEFMVYPHGQEGGLSQCGHFSDNGEWSIFRDFMRTSFMDRPEVK